jgi:hypothetical protein
MKIYAKLFSFFAWMLLIFFTLTFYLLRVKLSGLHYGATDFFKFYQSMRFYFSGQNLYTPTIIEIHKKTSVSWITANGNLNPPFFTLFLLPLYYFNYADALKIWSIGSLVSLFLSGWLVLRPFPQWHKYTLPILTAFAIYIPNSANFAYGQISTYLLVLLAGTWLCGRNKQDICAGILIGIACAVKIFCGLFLIYFLCISRFRLLFTACLTGAAAFLSSVFIFGLDSYFQYHLVLKKIIWYSASWNASFYGFFMRLFSQTEKNKPLFAVPYLTDILTLICSAALLVYLVYSWRKLGSRYFDIGFSLTLISMLLLSPLGWMYYFGILLIPFLVLIDHSAHSRHQVMIAVNVCIFLLLSTLAGDFLVTSSIQTKTQIFFNGGVSFYALIGLLMLYVIIIKEKLNSGPISLPSNSPIGKKQWIIFYLFAFIPSLMSFFYIIRNVMDKF